MLPGKWAPKKDNERRVILGVGLSALIVCFAIPVPVALRFVFGIITLLAFSAIFYFVSTQPVPIFTRLAQYFDFKNRHKKHVLHGVRRRIPLRPKPTKKAEHPFTTLLATPNNRLAAGSAFAVLVVAGLALIIPNLANSNSRQVQVAVAGEVGEFRTLEAEFLGETDFYTYEMAPETEGIIRLYEGADVWDFRTGAYENIILVVSKHQFTKKDVSSNFVLQTNTTLSQEASPERNNRWLIPASSPNLDVRIYCGSKTTLHGFILYKTVEAGSAIERIEDEILDVCPTGQTGEIVEIAGQHEGISWVVLDGNIDRAAAEIREQLPVEEGADE